jgi:hypothetical protein
VPKDHGGKVYCRAAVVSKETSYSVYIEVADFITYRGCDLSVFRFRSSGIPLVAVVGDAPPDDQDEQIRGILNSKGILIDLPENVLHLLEYRRRQESIPGVVVERRFRRSRRSRP